MRVRFKKWVFLVTLWTLTLNSIWMTGVTHAKIVDVWIDCNGPEGALQVYPDTAVVSPGDTVRWGISFGCLLACYGAANRWEIVIPSCPPLFPAGFSHGGVIPSEVISPAIAGCPGICKYTVKLYGLIPEFPCASLDPYIQCVGGETPTVPTFSEWVLILLALSVGGFFIWQLKKRRKAVVSAQ